MIDKASVFAERFKSNPQILQATVLGQGPDPSLDPYTALRALQLIKESNAMAMARQAQQPTSAPSLASQAVAPQGLAAMVPMGAPVGQMPQQMAQAPQAPVMQASGGLASMPTPDHDYAEGGIVAFQSGGNTAMSTPAVSANPLDTTQGEGGEGEQDDYLAMLDEIEGGAGSPGGLAAANRLALATARRIASSDLRDLTPEEAKTRYADEYKRITDAAGPSPFIAMRADLAEQRKEQAGNLQIAQGEALLEAASAVLEGNNAIRGLAKGGAQFVKSYGAAQRADQAAKRSMAQLEYYMADAERKERAGNSRAASAAVENARKERRDLNKMELDRNIALGRLATEMGKFNKLPRAAGTGANLKDFIVGPETYLAQIKEEHPEWSPAKQKAEAFKIFQNQKSAGLQGAVLRADTAREGFLLQENVNVQKAMKSFMNSPRYLSAAAQGDDAAKEAFDAELVKQRSLFPKGTTSKTQPSSSTEGGQPDYSNLWNQTPTK